MKQKYLSEMIICNELGLITHKIEDIRNYAISDKEKIERLCNAIKDHDEKLRNLFKNEKVYILK